MLIFSLQDIAVKWIGNMGRRFFDAVQWDVHFYFTSTNSTSNTGVAFI
jgi:hypothetical protein